MNELRPSYYAIIPSEVRYDKDLNPNAKLLYGEITALCNKEGYCWATNRYFAELYGVTTVTISRWLKDLIDKNYVYSKMYHQEGSKKVQQRRIYLSHMIYKEIDTLNKNVNTPLNKNVKGTLNKNVKDNNTSINNTNREYVYREVDANLKKISQLYQDNIGMINGVVAEDLKVISQEVSVELFEQAIKIAVDKGKFNFGYIKGILNQWRKNNIKTLNDLKERQPAKRKVTQKDKMKQEGHYGSKLNAKTVERTLKAEEIKNKFGL